MKKYLNLLKKTANSGFTLVELIVASMLTIFVVGGAGYGVFIMTRENVASNAATDTQYNLNRAAEFISDEIKAASAISVSSSSVTVTGCGTITPALTLTVPFTATSGTSAGTSAPYTVYYYSQAPGSPWLGSNAIYRCGPSLQASGANAGSVSINTTTGLPSDSTSNILVDLIASTRNASDAGCPTSTGWTASTGTSTGFFVCKNQNLAELHLAASAIDTAGNSGLKSSVSSAEQTTSAATSRFADKAKYGIITQAYTRASNGVPITISGTTLNFTENARATLRYVSGACSTNPTIRTGGTSGTPTLTTETWTNPATNTSFPAAGILYPSINSPVTITPSATSVSAGSDSNQVTIVTSDCTFTLTLRRAV